MVGAVAGYVGMLSTRRWSQGTSVVLWLRKFGVSDSERSIFTLTLGSCCAGFAVPVTLQDSSLQYSYQEAAARSLWTLPLAIVFSIAAVLFLALPSLLIVETASFLPYFIVLTTAALLAFVPVARWLWERGGAFALIDPQAIERFLLQIKSGKPRTGGIGGIAVLTVEDAKWSEAVEIALRHTDVLVVDVSRLTPHLVWELTQAKQHLVPRQIVLAYGVDPDEPDRVPDETQNTLASVLGSDTVAGCSWFVYTKRLPRWQLLRWRENKSRTLHLAALIAYALCHADSGVTFRNVQDELNSEARSNQIVNLGSLGLGFPMLAWWLMTASPPYTLIALGLAGLLGVSLWASGPIVRRMRKRLG
jgi:hypothetical protein